MPFSKKNLLAEISSEEKKRFRELEKRLGYSFKKKQILKQSLVHKSYANERHWPSSHHNERLEFLGDAVLEIVASEFLMERYADFSEGELSKFRASIVNERQLADIARLIHLGDFLYLGKGEEQTAGREKSSILADCFEALLGGVYIDGGFKKATILIRRFYEKLLERTPVQEFYRDYKTDLQEKSQALFRSVPRYKLTAERGPDHEKIFEIELYIRDRLMGHGSGRSKKEAEQQAAREALEQVNGK